MKFNITGIKCDSRSCNYKDISVKVEDYPNYVNKPCPVCGAILLTERDYQLVQNILKLQENKIINFIEKVFSLFGSKKETIQEFDMNGSGKITLKNKPPKEDEPS
jgi:hypothetical protein